MNQCPKHLTTPALQRIKKLVMQIRVDMVGMVDMVSAVDTADEANTAHATDMADAVDTHTGAMVVGSLAPPLRTRPYDSLTGLFMPRASTVTKIRARACTLRVHNVSKKKIGYSVSFALQTKSTKLVSKGGGGAMILCPRRRVKTPTCSRQ